MQYRIAWEYIESGFKGHGDYCLSKMYAEYRIVDLNIKYHGVIRHWIEPEPSEESYKEVSEDPSTDPCTHVT